VVQDAAVHSNVSLVGLAMAQGSTRPNLPWTFIVLDTDGVNAFAARRLRSRHQGASRAPQERSGARRRLGHEIVHITEKHTIRAIQKSKAVQMGAAETLSGNSALMQQAVTATYDNIVDRGFGRADENESDEKGVALANKGGYAPNGLVSFLTTLKDRNKGSTENAAFCVTRKCRSASIGSRSRLPRRSWRRRQRCSRGMRRTSASRRSTRRRLRPSRPARPD
jgi:predicted Zn-dependent protease